MTTPSPHRLALIGLGLATILLSLVPFFQTAMKGGYQGVPPTYVDDDLYYYARMREVADGQPFLGNPYFLEHRYASSVAFSITDWLATAPLLAGISFTSSIIFNFIFWSLVFSLLAYCIFRICNLAPSLAAAFSLLAYCEIYWLVMRPVIMQEVLPFFLLFIIAFFIWHREPLRRRSIFLLIAASTLSFYVYSYLWQIIFMVLTTVFLHRIISRRWAEVKSLSLIALGTTVGAMPMIASIIGQIRDPLYWETFSRIGLVATHLPSLDAYHYGRWAVLFVVMCIIARLLVSKYKSDVSGMSTTIISSIVYLGIGLVVASVSNMVTGVDVSTGQHIGRFITLYVAMFFPVLLVYLLPHVLQLLSKPRLQVGMLGVLAVLIMGFLSINLKRSLPFIEIAGNDITSIQEYSEPLRWLDTRENRPIVIWADDAISSYIPILTKHYVFWSSFGNLHMMETREAQERYLASRISPLSTSDDVGVLNAPKAEGIARQYADTYNKNALRCFFHIGCEAVVSINTAYTRPAVNDILKEQNVLRKNIRTIMMKYHVAYLLADTLKREDVYFKSLAGGSEVWRDSRFIIYAFK